MKRILKLTLAAMILVPAIPAFAQDMKVEVEEGVTYSMVEMTKYKPGARTRAIEIIRDYFAMADRMTGEDSGVRGVHLMTGEWDTIYTFPLKEGLAELRYLTSPSDIAWTTQLNKLTGSQVKSDVLLKEYDSLVDHTERHLAHTHADH